MKKPKDYDITPVMGDWKPLPAGGYICKIMSVEETVSKNGYEMIRVCCDIAEGPEKDRFTKEWKSNDKEAKYWGCVSFILVYDFENKSATSKSFKTFITAVEKSNAGFTVQWVEDADKFAAQFKSKAIGLIFGREEYLKADGKTTAWKTAPKFFRTVDAIRNNEFAVPADKPLGNKTASKTKAEQGDFEELQSDDDLPF